MAELWKLAKAVNIEKKGLNKPDLIAAIEAKQKQLKKSQPKPLEASNE